MYPNCTMYVRLTTVRLPEPSAPSSCSWRPRLVRRARSWSPGCTSAPGAHCSGNTCCLQWKSFNRHHSVYNRRLSLCASYPSHLLSENIASPKVKVTEKATAMSPSQGHSSLTFMASPSRTSSVSKAYPRQGEAFPVFMVIDKRLWKLKDWWLFYIGVDELCLKHTLQTERKLT